MKKIAIIVLTILVSALLICFIVFLPCESAMADSLPEYVRITTDDVFLYADCNAVKKICTLEKTFYLPVLDKENNMYLVSLMGGTSNFPKICGYVFADKVESVSETPVSPLYPTVTLTVSTSNTNVKLFPQYNAETVLVATNSQKLSYYGTIDSNGKSWHFVYCYGTFGYVDSESVTKPVFALHPTPLQEETVPVVVTPTEDTDEPTDEQTLPVDTTSNVILVVFVIALSVSLVLALFLPMRKKKQQ